jgi:general secretion pathway protein K
MTSRHATARQRGFALVIVLWSMALLALLGGQMTAASRVQQQLAARARDRAVAEAAADGATREAMFILLGGGHVGSADRPTRLRVGPADVTLFAEDEAVRINPNVVSRDAMRGLLAAVGIDQARAALLADEIADWRSNDPESLLGGLKIDQYREHGLPYRSGDHGFYSVDEIGLVPDMTPEVLARLGPYLSVYHEGGVSDPGGGSPAAAAIGDTANSGPGTAGLDFVSGNVVMRVTAVAVIPGGARFVRSAVVRIRFDAPDAATGAGLAQILTWD